MRAPGAPKNARRALCAGYVFTDLFAWLRRGIGRERHMPASMIAGFIFAGGLLLVLILSATKDPEE